MSSSVNVGLHWPRQGATYRADMPAVENCYLQGEPEGSTFTLPSTMDRVDTYAERHPEARILLRIDYARGEAFAGMAATSEYEALIQPISQLKHLGRRLVVQCGNEPQLESAHTVGQVARAYKATYDAVRHAAPLALMASTPVAPYNSRRLDLNPSIAWESIAWDGAPAWADVAYSVLIHMLLDRRPPDVLSVHAYSDGDRINVVDADGDAFAWNVLATWHRVHKSLHLDDLPVWVSEFNTAARGTFSPHRPADNYVPGIIGSMVDEAPRLCPATRWATWFVGESRGAWGAFVPPPLPSEPGHGALCDLAIDLDRAGAGPLTADDIAVRDAIPAS